MQASELQALIQAALPDADVSVRGEGDHFEAVVVSPQFTGRTRVQQHRLVYAALGDRMGGEIHALALRTSTPEDRRGPTRP